MRFTESNQISPLHSFDAAARLDLSSDCTDPPAEITVNMIACASDSATYAIKRSVIITEENAKHHSKNLLGG